MDGETWLRATREYYGITTELLPADETAPPGARWYW
jgi:hypothetical protein